MLSNSDIITKQVHLDHINFIQNNLLFIFPTNTVKLRSVCVRFGEVALGINKLYVMSKCIEVYEGFHISV